MRIGFTYDLQDDYIKAGFSLEEAAEFDVAETIDGIEDSLKKLGYEVDRRGNVKSLVSRVAAGERWDLVFNIAEGVNGFGREAEVPAVLEAYGIPFVFSDPMVLSLALHKGMAKRIVRDAGIATPDFQIVYSPEDIDKVKIDFPLFAKPLSEGTGKGIGAKSIIGSRRELVENVTALLQEHGQPVLVEKFLPGREFTVGITGTGKDAKAVGVIEINFLEDAESKAYGLVNKKHYQSLMRYTVPEHEIAEKCIETALAAWKVLECRDGGRIDLRCNEAGIPEFIEVNPLAGLNPSDSDLPILGRMNGVSYDEIIARIMKSAEKRISG